MPPGHPTGRSTHRPFSFELYPRPVDLSGGTGSRCRKSSFDTVGTRCGRGGAQRVPGVRRPRFPNSSHRHGQPAARTQALLPCTLSRGSSSRNRRTAGTVAKRTMFVGSSSVLLPPLCRMNAGPKPLECRCRDRTSCPGPAGSIRACSRPRRSTFFGFVLCGHRVHGRAHGTSSAPQGDEERPERDRRRSPERAPG